VVWGFALIILVLCAPWYIFVGRLSFYGHPDTSVINSAPQVLSSFGIQGMQQLRFLLILSTAGIVACLRGRLPITGKTAILLALPVAVLGFSLISGVEFEPRFLIPAILPMLTLAGYGAAWLAAAVPIRSLREPLKIAVLCGLAAIVFAAGSAVPKSVVSANDGLQDLLKEMRCKTCPSGAILVVGPSGGADGRIIAGFAESLPYRPQEILLRAVKVLARADWSGGHYSSRFHEPDQIIQELDSDGVSLIALDVSQRWGPWRPHEQLLLSTIERYPDRVELIYSSDRSAYRLYRFLSKTPPHVPGRLLDNLKEKVNRLSF
jgi:hypothetical protein